TELLKLMGSACRGIQLMVTRAVALLPNGETIIVGMPSHLRLFRFFPEVHDHASIGRGQPDLEP
ncbi:MAG TPA: hypothetical protein VFG85_10985, partial [Gaiellaceae bacterium]|nr:hypothetical protein [Gaiellaceae bacterium]